jgi:hypothetical protein
VVRVAGGPTNGDARRGRPRFGPCIGPGGGEASFACIRLASAAAVSLSLLRHQRAVRLQRRGIALTNSVRAARRGQRLGAKLGQTDGNACRAARQCRSRAACVAQVPATTRTQPPDCGRSRRWRCNSFACIRTAEGYRPVARSRASLGWRQFHARDAVARTGAGAPNVS